MKYLGNQKDTLVEMNADEMQKYIGGHAYWGCSTPLGSLLGEIDDFLLGGITNSIESIEKYLCAIHHDGR